MSNDRRTASAIGAPRQKKIAVALTAVGLLAAMTLASQAPAFHGFEGTMKVKPKVLKKGKKVTATANQCASGVAGDGRPYTAFVEFRFVPPSRPAHSPTYLVRGDDAGVASKPKRLKAVGTWEVVARCLAVFSDGSDEGAGVYEPELVHVLRRH